MLSRLALFQPPATAAERATESGKIGKLAARDEKFEITFPSCFDAVLYLVVSRNTVQ
jgi:hypothetical protein